MSEKVIKLAIVDDHPTIIDGLRNTFSTLDFVSLTATYPNGARLLQGLQQEVPDILILDAQLPDIMAHELLKELLRDYPSMRVLVFSGIESAYYIQNMLKQGCHGYIMKSSASPELLSEALQAVSRGKIFIDPSISAEIKMGMTQGSKKELMDYPKLTQREKEILAMIVEEKSNLEIANKLFISLRTVENHRYHLLQKLKAKNTVALIKIAMQIGLMR